MYRLDKVDIKIINLLQRNARITLKDISSAVYLPSPAVSARIDKLEKFGIIEGYHAKVNREVLGFYENESRIGAVYPGADGSCRKRSAS